jgi:hypothetical protein
MMIVLFVSSIKFQKIFFLSFNATFLLTHLTYSDLSLLSLSLSI